MMIKMRLSNVVEIWGNCGESDESVDKLTERIDHETLGKDDEFVQFHILF